MLNFNDIVQITILCVLIAAVIGYCSHDAIKRYSQRLRYLFLSPRYLKSTGILQRKTSTKVKPENDSK